VRLTSQGWLWGAAIAFVARFDLKAAKRHCKKKFHGKKRARCIKRAKRRARAL
jgi:hypothetical protein